MSAQPRPASIDFSVLRSALLPRVEFQSVKKLYMKPLINNGEEASVLEEVGCEFTLWKAYRDQKQPPIVIYDPDGSFRPGHLSYSLVREDEDFEYVTASLPEKVRKDLDETRAMYGPPPETGPWRILYRVVPSLRSPKQVREVLGQLHLTWGELVSQVVNFRSVQMDPRLQVIRRCHLLKGRTQAANGHAIVCLPGNTGKSSFYELAGLKDEKVSANSTVGYADTDGAHPGSVDGTEYTFAMDQFESQGGWGIFRYLPSLMENGRARVDNAASPFVVKSQATFVVLANPGRGDPTKSFMVILEHMLREPALGRRFGILLYDTVGVPVSRRLTRHEEEEWRQLFEFYRAVEAAADPKLRQLYDDGEVWNWLNAKPYGWLANMTALLEPLGEELEEELQGLHSFLMQFVENGQVHTRGAALASAVASNLDKVLLDEISVEELLAQAEDVLAELLDMNEQSIRAIAKNLTEERRGSLKGWFDSRPAYLREIIRATVRMMKDVEKDASQSLLKVNLLQLARYATDPRTFSKVVDRARKASPESYNEELKRRLGFTLSREGRDVMVMVESFDIFDKFDIFDIVGGKDVAPTGPLDVHESEGETSKSGGEGAPAEPVSQVSEPEPIIPPPELSEPEEPAEPTPPEVTPTESTPKSRIVPFICADCGEECDPFQENFVIDKRHYCRRHFLARAKSKREERSD